jgi:hypothetical protein
VYTPAPLGLPTASRRAERPPRYLAANFGRINRYGGPEDGALADRCLTLGLPEFGTAFGGSFRRIVQTPGGISMFYHVGQGEGWQRNIVMDRSPHLPAGIRQWYGDSRGHWEGDTLVIDVTNFSAKTDFQGSRENLHLIERWSGPVRTPSTTKSPSKTRPCGRDRGPPSRSSPGRASGQIEYITSRAASKETPPCHR